MLPFWALMILLPRDLRVGHFLGLHALQVLSFLGWLLSRRRGVLVFLSAADRLALVWTGGLAYLGLVAIAVWQAMRASPSSVPIPPRSPP